MAYYIVCPKPKKIISQIFKNQRCIGIFMSLCDQSPQFYHFMFYFFYFFIVLIMICGENPAKYPSLAKNPPKYTTAYIVQQSNCRWHCEPNVFQVRLKQRKVSSHPASSISPSPLSPSTIPPPLNPPSRLLCQFDY